ncbi:MAG: endonuclease/exonuclease/phosphatase family protein [Prevotella sp.]
MIALLLFIFTFVEYNVENLFDTMHDQGKQDEEFLPNSSYHWTRYRYWRKLDHISQALVSCSDTTLGHLPDMAVLTEVENDTVMRDLTRRSPLRNARYEYVMTNSPDQRGIDVALLYSPFAFRLLNNHAVRINPPVGHRPTRDILYASGIIMSGDTLHVIAVHAPSRAGGEAQSQPYRMIVAKKVIDIVDSINQNSQHPLIIVAGDFNDYSKDATLQLIVNHNMTEASLNAKGLNGARGTYRYHGEWGSLDHIFCNERLVSKLKSCHINDSPFLLEEDKKYGGAKPHRTFLGPRYLGGFSDHLPLVAVFAF